MAHSHVASVAPSGYITIKYYTFKGFWQQEFLIIPLHALNPYPTNVENRVSS